MRSQPGAKQRPETFQGVDVNFKKSVAIFISSILPPGIVDTFVLVTPGRQTVVNGELDAYEN